MNIKYGFGTIWRSCYVDLIKKNLIDIKDDGSFKLNQNILVMQLT